MKIRDSIAAAGASFIDPCDRAQERGYGGPGAAAQDLCLGLTPRLADEPGAEPRPARLPELARVGQPNFPFVIEDVDGVPASGGLEETVDALTVNGGQAFGDVMSGDDQFADEPLEIIDQGLLVGEEPFDADAVQVNRALQAAQKRLGPAGQLLEACRK
jgi:hypothetical protein